MPAAPLTSAEIDQALTELPGWTVRDGRLTASFEIKRGDVPEFYVAVAAAEDEANHHAYVDIIHGTIGFALNTHNADGAITAQDTALAIRITALAAQHGAEIENG